MRAWRLCKRVRVEAAFDGRGAAQYPGRWNGPNIPIVYTAESRALAALEVLVHTEDPRILSAARWSMISVDMDDSLIETLQKPPPDWRELPAPASTRALGSRWAAEARSVVLQVPSIVVDGEFNYLLNPQHSDFARLTIGKPIEFSFDPRLSRRQVLSHDDIARVRSHGSGYGQASEPGSGRRFEESRADRLEFDRRGINA